MEILLEFLFEIIAQALAAILEHAFYALSDRYMSDTKAKRRAKYVIGSILLAAVIGLTVYGLIVKRGPIVVASLSFILAIAIIRAVIFFNGKDGKKWINVLFGWIARVLHYGFAITIIVLAAIYVDGQVAKPVLIVCAILAIFVFFFIDMHKVRQYYIEQEQKKNKN